MTLRTRLLLLGVGLAFANFTSVPLGISPGWGEAVERTWFQTVALVAVWLTMRKT